MINVENIRKRRRELDFTQKQMSEKCHITQSYYSYIERGVMTPSIEILCGILKILGLQLVDVVKS